MSYASDAIRVGLLGCGTVGGGVLTLLRERSRELASRIGAPLVVGKVLVRDLDRPRVDACERSSLTTSPSEILDDPRIDVVVELMGGEEPAYDYVRRAMTAGKSVVTGNKMLLARHGFDLVGRAEASGVDLAFEASVGGGVPIVRTLRDALSGDSVERFYGIVNGTCNFILSRMQGDSLSFGDALAEAQAKGYAEADPALDVDGHDVAHKAVVLAMLAFSAWVGGEEVPTEGIAAIEAVDHRFADRFGFVIKQLAVGRRRGETIELRVGPSLLPKAHMLANVGSVLNAVFVEGEALGPCLLSGRGAGAMPTAVSVISDLVDVSRRKLTGSPAAPPLALTARPLFPLGDLAARYYLRFTVDDRPGVLADIAGRLGDEGISIEEMVQDGHGARRAEPVSIVMITHQAREASLRRALSRIATADSVRERARVLRIEEP